LGDQLLTAAEDYLYYCPTHFAGQNVPCYGIKESLWVPWYGSTERMGVSASSDSDLIAWLSTRSYQVVNPGDVSMLANLRDRSMPQDPALTSRGLALVPVDERMPWTGEEPSYRLRNWGRNGGRPYRGLVVADGDRAVGGVVWYPLPDPGRKTAALAWLGLERCYRGLRFGSYLLDCALLEMQRQAYQDVEVHVHIKSSPEAHGMFRNRGFTVIDYWVNLVKT
jgi:GNAT superfamily N-acetyltransferase